MENIKNVFNGYIESYITICEHAKQIAMYYHETENPEDIREIEVFIEEDKTITLSYELEGTTEEQLNMRTDDFIGDYKLAIDKLKNKTKLRSVKMNFEIIKNQMRIAPELKQMLVDYLNEPITTE
ncbi:MAG: hypothetical protein EOL93_01895 [Epsilonproteobacteria bacterium]|nr:hypothetical protein [Campylobacterota bacterium]